VIRTIADLYLGQKDYDHALDFLQKIKASDSGNDPSLDKKIGEIALARIDRSIAALDSTDVDFEADQRELRQQRLELEIQSARQLVERYPSELQYRFDLGVILFKSGKISEAIQEFQKAQANPHKRVATLNYLGQCFAKRGMHDVAVRTFKKALDEKTSFDDEKKDLVYQLGLAHEAMGNKDEAIESFKQIYEVDIGFRDVGVRVDAYYADRVN
jgi:tetratricopeptide (TPR) repeat protein